MSGNGIDLFAGFLKNLDKEEQVVQPSAAASLEKVTPAAYMSGVGEKKKAVSQSPSAFDPFSLSAGAGVTTDSGAPVVANLPKSSVEDFFGFASLPSKSDAPTVKRSEAPKTLPDSVNEASPPSSPEPEKKKKEKKKKKKKKHKKNKKARVVYSSVEVKADLPEERGYQDGGSVPQGKVSSVGFFSRLVTAVKGGTRNVFSGPESHRPISTKATRSNAASKSTTAFSKHGGNSYNGS